MKLNYKKIDQQTTYRYRADKQEAVEALGYDYISEAAVKLYLSDLSSKEVGDKIGVSEQCIIKWIRKFGVPMNRNKAHWNYPDRCRDCGTVTTPGKGRALGRCKKCYRSMGN